MDPIAPFAKLQDWGPSPTAAVALLIGVGFGWALERAGFGNAKTLAGQWYGYNFAVLRVMFTAIVVALVGLFGLHYAGVVDISRLSINETFIWPQVVGGLIFGVGFVVGQYCPGTAIVACATGKFDAMVFMGGFFVGSLVFFVIYPALETFYLSSAMGRVLLPEALHVSAGVIVFGVVLMALGAFALTHVLDRRFGNDRAR